MEEPLRDGDPRWCGPYEVLSRLGTGGMGVVFAAREPGGARVAVKVLRPEFADDAEFRERFRREARSAKRVTGQGVARLLAWDVSTTRPWLATEYVGGVNLGETIRRQGRLSGPDLRALAGGLADAVATIHAAGVVHRDLKPSNVLLTPEGPKVIDFGVSAAADFDSLTRTGVVVGTPRWMAPEQLRGERTGPPADVFAWGLCVTYAARGASPFEADRSEAVAYRIMSTEPDLDGVPDDLLGPVRAALAKEPGGRPSAAQIRAALTTATAPGRPPAVADAAAGEVAPGPIEAEVRATTADPGRRRGRAAPAVLACALGIGAVFGIRALAAGGSGEPTTVVGRAAGAPASSGASGPAVGARPGSSRTYSEDVRSGYLHDCARGHPDRVTYCRCTLRRYELIYPQAQFVAIRRAPKTGSSHTIETQVARACTAAPTGRQAT